MLCSISIYSSFDPYSVTPLRSECYPFATSSPVSVSDIVSNRSQEGSREVVGLDYCTVLVASSIKLLLPPQSSASICLDNMSCSQVASPREKTVIVVDQPGNPALATFFAL